MARNTRYPNLDEYPTWVRDITEDMGLDLPLDTLREATCKTLLFLPAVHALAVYARHPSSVSPYLLELLASPPFFMVFGLEGQCLVGIIWII